MTLDDRSLREHLERRAQAGALDVTTLTEAVLAGSSGRRQASRFRRLDSRFLGVGVAAAVAVAMLGAVILLPPRLWPSPGVSADASPFASVDASPRATAGAFVGYPSEDALTTDELFTAVLDEPGAQVGALLIADVSILNQPQSCPYTPQTTRACGFFVIRSPTRSRSIPVHVGNASIGSAPYAFRVGIDFSLEFVSSVQSGPKRLAWTLAQVADALAASDALLTDGGLVLVDAWLGSLRGSPFCPLAVPQASGVVAAFTCGQASWVLPDGNAIEPLQRGFGLPEVGLRLPNSMGALGEPHGFWLIKPIGTPSGCFLCPPSGAATLVGRVDSIDRAIQPDPSVAKSGTYPAKRALTSPELAAFIDDPWFAQAGPLVVADVVLTPLGLCSDDYSCPWYSIAVPGRIDPILVWDDRPAGPTPPATAGPIAYRVKTDVPGLDLIGPVRGPADGLAWALPRLAPLLPGIRATRSPNHPLLLVDGWLKTTPDMRSCIVVPTPQPSRPDFTDVCGQGLAWLIPEESVQSGDGPQPTWLRVPYYALPETLGAEPVHGYWLVDPLVSADGCDGCTSTGPADLLGRVRSLIDLRAAPTPGNT